MYYLSTSCLILFFLFSFFHHLPCASSIQERGLCETLFQCGNITAGFPFWGENRLKHCGHPLLELRCFKNITSIFISNQEFFVSHINQTSNTLTLVRTDLLGSICSSRFTTTTLPPDIFELSPTYKSLTIFYFCTSSKQYNSINNCPNIGLMVVSENPDEYHNICDETFSVNVPKSFVSGEKEFNMTNFDSVLSKGFEVKVKINDTSCQECSSSHGSCDFNETLPLGAKCSPLHPLPPTDEELHGRCSTPFSCGDQRGLLYPFWILCREECGHPDFELDCSRGFAEVSISSVKFRILEANNKSGIIRLARVDYINNLCPLNPPNPPFNENVLPFAPETETLTIFYSCGQDFSQYDSTNVGVFDCEDDDPRNYYVTKNLSSPLFEGLRDLLNEFRSCGRNVSIPASRTALSILESNPSTDHLKKALEEGFEVGVNLDCQKCMESKGACGYNQTHPSVGFVCYPRNKDGLSKGVIADIAVGASVLGLAMLILAGWFCLIGRRRMTQEAQYTSRDLPITKEVACLSCIINQQTKTSALSQEYLKALIPLKQYSYVQVKKITKSFAEVIGKGGFGTVYRGTLSDGHSVAVKILKDSKGNGEDFINEVASMSKTSHVNIVTLLGFCSEGSRRAIIYEYLENGSLDQFISSKRSSNIDSRELYGIALGVARGLEYLHHGCRTRIVHFDIKPQNVLLDDNLCPKVSDFGLAKLCEKKESILSLLDTRGTIGYIAPEVFLRMYGRVSHKSDVYSYGMLLLEMIGARNKESFDQNSASNTSSMYFPEWIYKDLEKVDSGRLIENEIISEAEEVTKKMTLVGLWCIQPFPSDRPAMNRVVEMMEGNLDALEVPPRPVLQNPPVPLQESSTFSEDISVYTEV